MKRLVFITLLLTFVFFQDVFSMKSSSSRDEELSDFDSEIDKDILNFLEFFKDLVRFRFNLPEVNKKVVARNKKKIRLFIRCQLRNQNKKFLELENNLDQLIFDLENFSKMVASLCIELDEGVVFDVETDMLGDAYNSVYHDSNKDTKKESWSRALNSLNELEEMLQKWHSNILGCHEKVYSEIQNIIYFLGNIKDLMYGSL